MGTRRRLAALSVVGLLLVGGAACQPDETIEESDELEDGGDTGEGAPPEGGVGEEGVEGEGPIDEEPIDD